MTMVHAQPARNPHFESDTLRAPARAPAAMTFANRIPRAAIPGQGTLIHALNKTAQALSTTAIPNRSKAGKSMRIIICTSRAFQGPSLFLSRQYLAVLLCALEGVGRQG